MDDTFAAMDNPKLLEKFVQELTGAAYLQEPVSGDKVQSQINQGPAARNVFACPEVFASVHAFFFVCLCSVFLHVYLSSIYR